MAEAPTPAESQESQTDGTRLESHEVFVEHVIRFDCNLAAAADQEPP